MAKIHSLQSINDSLKKKFKGRRLVFGTGAQVATVVFVGESPDDVEEKDGKAFSGPTGKLLNQLLKKINLDKKKVYFTHVLKYRPSPTKAPTLKEIKSHVPFLKEEIKTVNPKVVVTLGVMALNGIGLKLPLGNVHGKVFHFGDYSLLPTYHPSNGAADPQIQSIIESEFVKLKTLLDERGQDSEAIA